MKRPTSVLVEFHTWDAGMSGITTYPSIITVNYGEGEKIVFDCVDDIEKGGEMFGWLYEAIRKMCVDEYKES
jgi:hypothetical protein